MAVEHTFLGTWEIAFCKFDDKPEVSGLEGIKFRLDDTGDITWYNDLVSPIPESKDCVSCCDSASVLFTCETFDVNEINPHLIFGAFAGHSIEFMTNTLKPEDTLVLKCENWYTLQCNRLKEGQAAGQEKEFSFTKALQEPYFSDVIIKSSDNNKYNAHSAILRLNGFDCSMCTRSGGNFETGNSKILTKSLNGLQLQTNQQNHQIFNKQLQKSDINFTLKTPNAIQVSVTLSANTDTLNEDSQKSPSCLNISPIFLQPPTEYVGTKQFVNINSSMSRNLITQRNKHFSNSVNCLPIEDSTYNGNESHTGSINCVGNTARNAAVCMRRFPPTSHSDSHLESQSIHCRNIFNFCQDLVLQSSESSTVCNARRPPLSPYRARSPSPFSSAMDTPPSSPLTPVSVLYNLPTFILTPVLHWLYTETLLPDMEEGICEKLINFAELQPSLTKMVEPIKKYLKLLRLKNFVTNIVKDLHRILDRIIQSVNPIIIPQGPDALYLIFKECLKECAIGCAKVLQFCNIFIKDAIDITRYQKNEIIKYIRTRIPIFLTQLNQLLRNILNIFRNFTEVEKTDLANFLVPEIETTLSVLTTLIEKIKNSLETMCKDIKCSQLELSQKQKANTDSVKQTQTSPFVSTVLNTMIDNKPPQLLRPRHIPPAEMMIYDNATDRKCLMAGENDLKFVLYMYEVRKMRDIYGRVSAALDIIQDKKTTFCEMNFYSKSSTIHQNLDQMVVGIPAYILLLENLCDRLDEKLGWKEFKFCFKLATSQINGIIVTLYDHKSALMDSINEVCKLVQKPEFTQSLFELGLLEHLNILNSELKLPDNENNMCSNGDCANSDASQLIDYKNVKLNLVRHLCESPTAANSTLSKNALRLLHSAQLADMEFEVHTYASCDYNLHNCGYTYENINPAVAAISKTEMDIQDLQSNEEYSQERHTPIQVHSFKAHRVIVSARCEWFKKALLSGMQESITRKIIITDTTPVVFRRLLLYLYGAPIDKTVGAEQICELMLLADRYSIEDLKELCETTLNTLIDEESVLCLLSIADHYMASALKSNCLSFLSQHASLIKTRMFQDLPQSLQLEVIDIIRWYGRISEPWNDEFKTNSNTRHNLKSPSNHSSRSRKSSPSYI